MFAYYCDSWAPHGAAYLQYCLLASKVVLYDRNSPVLWLNLLTSSPG